MNDNIEVVIYGDDDVTGNTQPLNLDNIRLPQYDSNDLFLEFALALSTLEDTSSPEIRKIENLDGEVIIITNTSDELDNCTVCCEALIGEVHQLPCKHLFHIQCISDSFVKCNDKCPNGRANIRK